MRLQNVTDEMRQTKQMGREWAADPLGATNSLRSASVLIGWRSTIVKLVSVFAKLSCWRNILWTLRDPAEPGCSLDSQRPWRCFFASWLRYRSPGAPPGDQSSWNRLERSCRARRTHGENSFVIMMHHQSPAARSRQRVSNCAANDRGGYEAVFSISFWDPRNPTREILVIPLDGDEAPLQISF